MSSPSWTRRLQKALVHELEAAGFKHPLATVDRDGHDESVRVFVVCDDFTTWAHTKRQTFVWDIAKQALSDEELQRVSAIHALTEVELSPDLHPPGIDST